MADLDIPSTGKKSKTAARQIRIDMTPMVDLGFLLITFFIFTAVVQKPTAMSLTLPVEDGSPTLTPETKTLTILLGQNNAAICYEGLGVENVVPQSAQLQSGRNDLRNIILAKQNKLKALTGTADSMIVIIRPGMESNYSNLVAVLDEMAICDVKKHAVASLNPEDEKLLALHQ